ncbi:MAG: hypothetical protein ACRC4T_03685 [Cetobacterium sp.]
MKKIKWLFSFKYIYIISLIYFFLGYFYPNLLQINNIYLYIKEYFGIYEKLLWIFLVGYGFSMFMKNPNKRVVLKTRLFFMIILGIATGYLYLLDSLKEQTEKTIDSIQQYVIQVGLLNINLGYIELYTFLKIFPNVKTNVFAGSLIFIIFLSMIVICGKMIRKLIVSVINFIKGQIFRVREERRLKEEQIRLEKQAKLEKDIYDEICNIQKAYQEKDRLEMEIEGNTENELILQVNISEEFEENLENIVIEDDKKDDVERINEDDDISIQIPEKERDISTVGISTAN